MSSKLYILTLVATRFDQATFTAGASTLLTVKDTAELAQTEGMQQVLEKFPLDEGWVEHQVSAFEVPARFETDSHSVAWTISALDSEKA